MKRSALFRALAVSTLSFCAGVTAVRAEMPNHWTSRGPGGGGAMYAPSFNPHNPNELFVACDMSPQFHTTDLGKTWETLSFRQLQSNKWSNIRFTKDPKICWTINYAASGGQDWARPCVSHDGGKTFDLPSPTAWPTEGDDERVASAIQADFDHPERAYVAAGYRHLFVTLDGGQTYTLKYSTQDKGGLLLSGSFIDGDTIYLGTNVGILVSTDGGKTFALDAGFTGIPEGEKIISMAGTKKDGKARFIVVTGKQAYVGITGGDHGGFKGVYVADPADKKWVKKVNGINEPAHPFFVSMANGDIDTAYLGGGYGYPKSGPCVFKTTDGGDTWTSVFQVENNANIITGWAGAGGRFGWSWPEYVLGLDVCPTDKERVAITDLGCVHTTTDGGKTWKAINTASSTPHEAGKPTPQTGTYAGNGMEPTAAWYLAWLDEKNMFAGFSDIRGIRSTDAGQTWSWDYTGHTLNASYCIVQHPKTNVAYMANSSVHDMYRSRYLMDAAIDKGKGGVMYSTDKGATWKPLKDFGHVVMWLSLDPSNDNRMYASVVHSTDGGIYVTDDLDKADKATWTKLPAPPRTEGHPMTVHALKDGGVVATYSGHRSKAGFSASSGFFVSADGGKTWEDRSTPEMQYWTMDAQPDPTDASQNTWYVGTFMAWGKTPDAAKHSGLFRTTDRGKTWTQIAGKADAPSTILNVQSCAVNPANPNELFFTTEYDGLFYTANAKAEKPKIEPVESYPFRNTSRVFFNPHKKGEVWVLSFGNGMYVGNTN